MEGQQSRFSPSYDASPEYQKPLSLKQPGSSSSGLRLVLPPLKAVLAAKANKKSKHRSGSTSFASSPVVHDVGVVVEKKPPRPVKLKPLKEVLQKLIHQIKKKDDYAFFLAPVDVKNVPGYLDVVKTPMDFGTMTDKVNRGRYRSLEEFADDFRLVTTNAKIFNPPGSIYHTEAERIETWGIEHINKAAGTVIQYEADWNIDVEGEGDPSAVNIEDDDDEQRGATQEPDETGRAGSVVSQQPTSGRRGPRGPYRKHNQQSNTLSESIEPDGRLPGSKDGLGSFPPGSDWAKTMLYLKLKGKRYKTKKERMRIEKEGPPTLPDGSLDYTEMEDPFSVLSFFVPDSLTRPALIPLYSPFQPVPPPSTTSESSQPPPPPQDQTRQSVPPQQQESQPAQQPGPQASTSYPLPSSLPFRHSPPDIPSIPDLTTERPAARRHWTIARGVSSRKGKEKEDEDGEDTSWQAPREVHPADFGSFSILAAELGEEMRRRGMAPMLVYPGQEQQIHFNHIRESLSVDPVAKSKPDGEKASAVDAADPQEQADLVKNYWTAERIAEAEGYIRDLVYGGEDGLAYVRSLAEFMDYEPVSEDEDMEVDEKDWEPVPPERTLGMPLAKWVEKNIVDPLTEGRHALLREAASILYTRLTKEESGKPASTIPSPLSPHPLIHRAVADQVSKSLDLYPVANAALAALLSINLHKIDMGALIKAPNELFESEEEWYGKELKERRKAKGEQAQAVGQTASGGSATGTTTGTGATTGTDVVMGGTTQNGAGVNGTSAEPEDDAMEVEEAPQTWAGVDANVTAQAQAQARAQAQGHGQTYTPPTASSTPGAYPTSAYPATINPGAYPASAIPTATPYSAAATVTPYSTAAATYPTTAAATTTAIPNTVTTKPVPETEYEPEGPEELKEVLDYAAAVILDLNRRKFGPRSGSVGVSRQGSREMSEVPSVEKEAGEGGANGDGAVDGITNGSGGEGAPTTTTTDGSTTAATGNGTSEAPSTADGVEDPVLRNLRLNLLALAKRAPLDTIARLPKELVPEHIRQYVPTLGSST
ncbi:hypothetical protein CC1G_07951 [Coprinopsis cinerea okayama7|uniref:Bromo domain-containing protein n=1 Tax=Coprinopsis cinerea (strain Okayama-7 / 130 / ATCC MYA-4618 / FGSC 9003) TaxID=240176 RepID=A8P202_COPC7|nr:hypothetical protein CC1G_07951 [Coprinopsis cinerea okayama7\|eukprot:XP_001838210.1 hypothetical protein CC1G_07951 [Coprinopsis cinerea okayama7\